MPEEPEGQLTTEAEETPRENLTIQDIYAEVRSELDNEDKQPETQAEDVPKEQVPDEDPLLKEAADDDAEDAGSDDEFANLQLDDSITDPEARRRWEEQKKGLQKLKSRLETQVQEVEIVKSYADHFGSAETGIPAIQKLAKNLAEYWGVEVGSILGDNSEKTASPVDDEYRFATEVESEHDKRLAKIEAALAEQKRSELDAKTQAENKAYAVSVAPKVAKQIATHYYGFEVTPQMVTDALAEYPQHKANPQLAVRAKFSDALIKHVADSVAKGYGKKAPEMIDARGGALTPPKKNARDMTAADIYYGDVKGRA